MKYDQDAILVEMKNQKWDADSDECLEKEQFILQRLRETDSDTEFTKICDALAIAGSFYCIPVLMAKMQNNRSKIQAYCFATLTVLMKRMQNWPAHHLENFFNPEWWTTRWVGSNNRFLSFISLISRMESDDLFNSQHQENLAQKLMQEMEFDPSPYTTFKELRIVSTDWDPIEDIEFARSCFEKERLMAPIYDTMGIAMNPIDIFAENIAYMRVDYLITKLGLYKDFDKYHALIKLALVLNEPE